METTTLESLINPSAKQREFLSAVQDYKYVLYGGAKGGGKSFILRWALVLLLLKWAGEGHERVRVALCCEDFPTLKDRQLVKIKSEFPHWLGTLGESATYGLSFVLKPEFGGGIISLRNLDDTSKYASSEFAAVAIDELTKNTKVVFDQFRSIIRWPGIHDTKFLAATNPGGVGHEWVRNLWIDRNFPPDEPEPKRFHFIQAFAKDNPYLAKEYLLSLQGLPSALRKAYLEGSWDIFEGQFFEEWSNAIHVVEPYKIPDTWRKFRAIDHGRVAPTVCGWGAIDFDGRIVWYREYYMAGKDADVNAKAIAELSKEDGKYWFSIMDSSCFDRTGTGETIADIYRNNGVGADPWPKHRIAGWNLFHEYLRVQEDGRPKMVFFSTCRNAIRSIPTLVHDPISPEDLLSKMRDDHWADVVRGSLEFMNEAKSPKPLNPLEKKLHDLKVRNRINAYNLRRFYANR